LNGSQAKRGKARSFKTEEVGLKSSTIPRPEPSTSVDTQNREKALMYSGFEDNSQVFLELPL